MDAQCTERSFKAISEIPGSIVVGSTSIIGIPLELDVDGKGDSWSLVCGYASVSFSGSVPTFLTYSATGGLTLAPGSNEPIEFSIDRVLPGGTNI